MRYGMSRASAGSNTTTASALIAPFLVAPNDSTSTPAAPGQLGRRAAERGDGVGEARAVQVHEQAVAMGDRAQRGDFGDRVQRAEIRRLREVERERLHARRVAAAGERERLVERRRLELVVAARQAHQLRAGEELRRAALVDVDVRRLVAVDRAVRIGERRRARPSSRRCRSTAGIPAPACSNSAREALVHAPACSRRRRRVRPCRRSRPRSASRSSGAAPPTLSLRKS